MFKAHGCACGGLHITICEEVQPSLFAAIQEWGILPGKELPFSKTPRFLC
jgi:hypothetical protein